MGLTGLAGRASAQAWDLRVQFAAAPYDQLEVRMATHRNGDVAARVIVRFEEVQESLRLLRTILDKMPDGPHRTALPAAPEGRRGVGWVEGWRGEVLIALETGSQGRLAPLPSARPVVAELAGARARGASATSFPISR